MLLECGPPDVTDSHLWDNPSCRLGSHTDAATLKYRPLRVITDTIYCQNTHYQTIIVEWPGHMLSINAPRKLLNCYKVTHSLNHNGAFQPIRMALGFCTTLRWGGALFSQLSPNKTDVTLLIHLKLVFLNYCFLC